MEGLLVMSAKEASAEESFLRVKGDDLYQKEAAGTLPVGPRRSLFGAPGTSCPVEPTAVGGIQSGCAGALSRASFRLWAEVALLTLAFESEMFR